MNQKIQIQHLEKIACVYLRQSTMKQVRFNQESTERQYALKSKAESLGWSTEKIKVLDGDLGLSGTQSDLRKDFQALVAKVSMNKVGAVFALEASRLSRSNTDWHRLIELCSFTGTLIIDEDGCYNPSDFNDQLLLGLKGTMSQAELHFIRARLQGGKRNKAKKGELRFPLPVGYCYGDENQVVLDPNEELRAVIALVFDLFKKEGSAYAVSHKFNGQSLKFPKRSYGGIWNGKIIWGNLTQSRVLSILKNPCYAGAYVYGRFGHKKQISPDGNKIQNKAVTKPMDEWEVMIKDHHEGYISWNEYEKNQSILKKNRTNIKDNLLPAAAREGYALLQGLLICKKCGRKVTIRYKGDNGCYPWYQCNKEKAEGLSTTECIVIQSTLIDQIIAKRISKVVNQSNIKSSIKIFSELEERSQKIDKQWEMSIQRAQYKADLAQRRYEEVDPSNRLVASTLEKKWNESLVNLEEVKEQYREICKKRTINEFSKCREELLNLSEDFQKLWESTKTSTKDKKRILRLLIKDITIGERQGDRKTIDLQIRWQGGALEELSVCRLKPSHEKWKHSPELVKRVKKLASSMTDNEIAEVFNSENMKTNKGNTFTKSIISWIRYKHKISAKEQRQKNEFTAKETMKKFGVSYFVVSYWIERKVVMARQTKKGTPWWITIDPETETKLKSWIINSSRINKHKISPNKFERSAV